MPSIGRTLVHDVKAIKPYPSREKLIQYGLKGAQIKGKDLVITDGKAFVSCLPTLAANVADFGEKTAPNDVRTLSTWIISRAAQKMGVKVNSPQEAYIAIAEGKAPKRFTIPAVNVRADVLDMSRALFRAAIDNNVGALIIELARSESGYTNQTPMEFAAVVQAAAIMEGFKGPLFLQGDHIQLKAKAVRAGGEQATRELAAHRQLIIDFLKNGTGSIDLDMSPFELRDRTELSHKDQQAENAQLTAGKIKEVRELEGNLGLEWNTLLGGETGEVGKQDTSMEDLRAYAEGIQENLQSLGVDPALGIRKIAVANGSAHGGIIGPDGKPLDDVKINFNVLRMATEFGRKFGWAGSVQHGASTLPESMFRTFVEYGAVEVHLATGFQNQLFDIAFARVPGFMDMTYAFLDANFSGEYKESKTQDQNWYSTRKKFLGPNKWGIWTLPESVRAEIAEAWYKQFGFLFTELKVVDTKKWIQEVTTDRNFVMPFPEEGAQGKVKAPSGKGDADLSD